jgi:hypothetical protein
LQYYMVYLNWHIQCSHMWLDGWINIHHTYIRTYIQLRPVVVCQHTDTSEMHINLPTITLKAVRHTEKCKTIKGLLFSSTTFAWYIFHSQKHIVSYIQDVCMNTLMSSRKTDKNKDWIDSFLNIYSAVLKLLHAYRRMR